VAPATAADVAAAAGSAAPVLPEDGTEQTGIARHPSSDWWERVVDRRLVAFGAAAAAAAAEGNRVVAVAVAVAVAAAAAGAAGGSPSCL